MRKLHTKLNILGLRAW